MTGNEWFIIGAAAVTAIGYAGYSFYARKKSFNEFLAQKEKRRTDPPVNVPKAAPIPPAPKGSPVPPRPQAEYGRASLSKGEQERAARFNETQRRLDRGALSDAVEDAAEVRRQAYVPPVYTAQNDRTPPACSKPSRSDVEDSHSHRSCSSSSWGDGGSSSSSSSSCSSSSDSGSSGCD